LPRILIFYSKSRYFIYAQKGESKSQRGKLSYGRGRKKRWVTTCHDCSQDPEFERDDNYFGIVTVEQQAEVYDSIEQVIREAGTPIALVDAVKFAASKDLKVRNYLDIDVNDDDGHSEDNRSLWGLIHEILSEGPNSRGIRMVKKDPILIVSCNHDFNHD
jgi:hypothetical protein